MTCRCGAQVLRGLDNDRCALTATVDPTPIGPARELVALASGRTTYDLVGRELFRRDRAHIVAAAVRYPIVLDHECEDK